VLGGLPLDTAREHHGSTVIPRLLSIQETLLTSQEQQTSVVVVLDGRRAMTLPSLQLRLHDRCQCWLDLNVETVDHISFRQKIGFSTRCASHTPMTQRTFLQSRKSLLDAGSLAS
jgi:hypothetical protein